MTLGIDTVITGGDGGGDSAISESGFVDFTGGTSEAVVYTKTYAATPIIQPKAKAGDVEPYIENDTALGATIKTPVGYTGRITYQVEGS